MSGLFVEGRHDGSVGGAVPAVARGAADGVEACGDPTMLQKRHRSPGLVESPYSAPRLTLRVGVTGHRSNKLADADLDALEAEGRKVLTQLADAGKVMQGENDVMPFAPYARGTPELRLATALAAGADSLIARAAIASEYDLNVILPFPRTVYEGDFLGAEREAFAALLEHERVRSLTELEVSSTRQDPAAYDAAGYAVLDYSDILIAIWDRAPAAGRGGTADVVDEARRRGHIVILLSPAGELSLWSPSPTAVDPVTEGVWTPFAQDMLLDRVRARLAFPEPLETGLDRLSGPLERLRRFAEEERLREGAYAFHYELLRTFHDRKRAFSLRVSYGLADKRAEAWQTTMDAAEVTGDSSYRALINERLRQRWIGADNIALHYSNKFRSAFVTNFALAAVAVLIAMIPVYFWDSQNAKSIKAAFVLIELGVIGYVVWNTRRARSQEWQRRWLDTRRLAESLRPARLPLLIASSPARSGREEAATTGEAWVAWYALASLREIPPPTGRIGPEAMERSVSAALQEVDEQISYHTKNAQALSSLDHGLEHTAEWALRLTLISGALYLLTWVLYEIGIKWPAEEYKALATILGATLPVIGAAAFGIRATGDFRSAISQSERMSAQLTGLRRALAARAQQPERRDLLPLYGRVGRTMAEDLKLWGMIYSERELTAGF